MGGGGRGEGASERERGEGAPGAIGVREGERQSVLDSTAAAAAASHLVSGLEEA